MENFNIFLKFIFQWNIFFYSFNKHHIIERFEWENCTAFFFYLNFMKHYFEYQNLKSNIKMS